MVLATIDEVSSFARSKLQEAREGSENIPFHLVERYQAKSMSLNGRKSASIEGSLSIVDDPRFSVLKHGTGQLAWMIVLAIDLRNSTWRAMTHGAEATYYTMHTYLPTMEYLIDRSGGQVIGLRGDGLFAGFGITEVKEGVVTFTPEVASRAAQDSVKCGRGMIEAVEDVINPLLEEEAIPGELEIGIGIDSGEVVVTRIGLDTANEVTAYGNCVNQACKRANGRNEIFVSQCVQEFYPKSQKGLVRFSFARERGYRLKEYPNYVLKRHQTRRCK